MDQAQPLTGLERATSVRNHVLALLPTASPTYQDALDAGKFYCVVEKHDNPLDFAAPDPESFLWLCAKPSLSLRKMFTHYKNRCPDGDDEFAITVAGDQQELDADGDAKFKDLPAPTDGVLLLTATRKQGLGDIQSFYTPTRAPRTKSTVKSEPYAIESPASQRTVSSAELRVKTAQGCFSG